MGEVPATVPPQARSVSRRKAATSTPEPIAVWTACSSRATSSTRMVSWANMERERFLRVVAASHWL